MVATTEHVLTHLVALLEANVVGQNTLIEVIQMLSAQGVTRPELVDMLYRLAFKISLTEDQVTMVGDFNHHLAGDQCPIGQVIKLAGDPEDPVARYHWAREQMKDWRPPLT